MEKILVALFMMFVFMAGGRDALGQKLPSHLQCVPETMNVYDFMYYAQEMRLHRSGTAILPVPDIRFPAQTWINDESMAVIFRSPDLNRWCLWYVMEDFTSSFGSRHFQIVEF